MAFVGVDGVLPLGPEQRALSRVLPTAFSPARCAARSLIAEAAQRASAEPAAQVTVAGYTDSAGSPPADVALSQQRAQVVADALIADGVAANRIARTGRGQTGGDPGVASRRVEITIGGV